MASIRADLLVLLQPRAKPPLQKGGKCKQGKGGGKKGGELQNKFRDEKSVEALTEAMKNLQLKYGNKTLCLRSTARPAQMPTASLRTYAPSGCPIWLLEKLWMSWMLLRWRALVLWEARSEIDPGVPLRKQPLKFVKCLQAALQGFGLVCGLEPVC